MQNKKSDVIIFCITIFILMSFFAQCKKEMSYIIEEKNGVKHVHNKFPKFEESLVSLKFVRQFGETDSENEDLWFAQPLDLVVDSQGSVFILDMGMNNIKKYDVNGNYSKTIGRKGQGPGEFQNIMKMEIDSEDNIYIVDIYGRVQIFDLDGNYQNEFRMQNFTIFFKMLNSKQLVINNILSDDNKNLLHLTDTAGDIQNSFCEMKDFHDARGLRYLNGIIFCKDQLNNFYVSFRSQNRIEKYNSEGELQFRANRSLNYSIHFQQDGHKTLNAGGQAIKIPKWDYSYVSRDMNLDYKNRLWLVTFKNQPPEKPEIEDIPNMLEFEIFSQDGILLYKLPFPEEPFDTIRIFGKRLFFIDPREEVCVREFEIIEN